MGRPKGVKNKSKDSFSREEMMKIAKVGDVLAGNPYHVSARIVGKTYTAEGGTLEAAIFNLKPLIKKGVCLLTVTHGDKSITKILNGSITHNLFNTVSHISREIAIKNLKTLFSF